MASYTTSPPATWKAADVALWATQARLTPEVVSAFTCNDVDGPTLVTLTKSELRSELGITSLPARRFCWELIKSLKSEQLTCDYSSALDVHQQEINSFSAEQQSVNNEINRRMDTLSIREGNGFETASSLSTVVDELITDAQKQRQVIADHMMAFRVQKMLNNGQDIICQDAEVAHEEQERLHNLFVQAESDREYAESLARGRDRTSITQRRRTNLQHHNDQDTPSEAKDRVSTLFGLSVQSCIENKVNVGEAFRNGKIKPCTTSSIGGSDGEISDDDVENNTKPAAVPTNLFNLPFIHECNVCYDENVKGYNLACGHLQCVKCTRKLFKFGLEDSALLPLTCCELPIDMHIANDLLHPESAALILQRVEEKEAKNKMYCPSCSAFINLDLVDSSQGSDLRCACGTYICTTCKTESHFEFTCQQNKAIRSGSDELILELSRKEGWKQCPKCSVLIELRSGCNHMTCTNCSNQFCYRCLRDWDTRDSQCTSGACELWDEDRLIEAGEARVQQEEAARGERMDEPVRRERLARAIEGLQANEICTHTWVRSEGDQGDCPNCGYAMWAYGMHCQSDCGSTVCYTCAHHRIPTRGWR